VRTPPRGSRERGAGILDLLLAVAVLALVGVAAYYYLVRKPAPEPAATRSPAPVTAKPAPPPTAPEPAPAAAAAPPEEPARKAPVKKAPAPAPAPAATLATLMVDSDVKGAAVFIDRQYAGTTPLKVDRLEPGTKQLKLTADGYEGIERSVELAAGENPVTMKFREVRLKTQTAVVHKHGVGSCLGNLTATVDGLAYDTTNKSDAFTIPFAQLETFAVDYLEKNLRVKQKGGKTWNFTDRNDNADKLFVFHRDVEAARKKLSEGYAPVR
jgi:PEGA domain